MSHTADRPRVDTRGLALLLFAVVGWGSNWAPLKLLLRELPPLTARAWAGLAAAALLALVMRARGVDLRVPRGLWPRLCLAALLNITAWMGLVSVALLWLDASEGIVLAYSMPVWAALIAWPVLGEKPTVPRVLALVCGIGGVALVMLGQGFNLGTGKLPGVALCLVASVSFALGTVVTKRWPLAMPAGAAVVWQVGLGMIPLIAGALLWERPDFGALSAAGWGVLAYMAVIPLCLCYLAWFAALRRLPASLCTQGSLLSPVVGMAGSALMLDEPFGPRQIAAFLLIVVGVVLAVRG
jgi:drug/metabolite transporter (DMT)-like permease